jgi:hypothetical protein
LNNIIAPLQADDLPQPSWNGASTIDAVLAQVAGVRSDHETDAAYQSLLYAVGNNHAGTYYPVVLALFPYFESILTEGSGWAQFVVLEALVDLCGSFTPEVGFENFQMGPGQPPQPLAPVVLQRARSLVPLVASIARGSGAPASSAAELLGVLRDEG